MVPGAGGAHRRRVGVRGGAPALVQVPGVLAEQLAEAAADDAAGRVRRLRRVLPHAGRRPRHRAAELLWDPRGSVRTGVGAAAGLMPRHASSASWRGRRQIYTLTRPV